MTKWLTLAARFYVPIAVVISAALLTRLNPVLFESQTLVSTLPSSSDHWLPTVYGGEASSFTSDGAGHAPVVYRGNPSRIARVRVAQLPIALRSDWQTPKFNVGVHSAPKASVVADADGVFVGSDTSWFQAFDRDGKLKWGTYLADADRGIHSTAVLGAKSLLIGTYRGTLYRLEKATGRIIWSRVVGRAIGASPFILDDSVIVNVETIPPDGYLMKIDITSGETIWQSPRLGEQSHSSPAYDPSSKTLVIGVNDSSIQGFDADMGTRRWKTSVAGPVKATAWLENGFALITTWGQEAIKIDPASGRIAWRHKLDGLSQISPVVSTQKNVAVVTDELGSIWGLDLESGRVRWHRKPPPLRQRFLANPVVLDDGKKEMILHYCETRRLCLMELDGTVIQSWETAGYFTGTPFVTDDAVYLALNEGGVQKFEIVREAR